MKAEVFVLVMVTVPILLHVMRAILSNRPDCLTYDSSCIGASEHRLSFLDHTSPVKFSTRNFEYYARRKSVSQVLFRRGMI